MSEKPTTGVSEEGGNITIVVPANKLSKVEMIVIFHVIYEHNGDHPVLAQLAALPVEALSRVLEMSAATIEVSMESVDGNMERTAKILEREALYKRLLVAGAPKEMLGRHFAKSRRQVESDRQAAGLSAAIAGRPRRIGTEQAYEIAGHWERLKEEEPGFPERVVMLHELFPDVGLASLCNLLEKL